MSASINLLELLQFAREKDASDLHLAVGESPAIRINGKLLSIKTTPLTLEQVETWVQKLFSDVNKTRTDQKDFDGAWEDPALGRIRFNIYSNNRGPCIAMRLIPRGIPTLAELGLPEVIGKIAMKERGLILVTGATGSGKSSTLAAMLNHINEKRPYHVLTIEDPVEFIHQRKRSRFTHREVGTNVSSFAEALRSALRQDPDVILVGELRDSETADIALKAAETGKLVLSTVHTTDSMQTISRFISLFPPAIQEDVRMRLSHTLVATISQRLVPKKESMGRVAALEIMINHSAVEECILNKQRHNEIKQFIQNGRSHYGSQTFDQHLAELYASDVITYDMAKRFASTPSDFERNANYNGQSGAKSELSLIIKTPIALEEGSGEMVEVDDSSDQNGRGIA